MSAISTGASSHGPKWSDLNCVLSIHHRGGDTMAYKRERVYIGKDADGNPMYTQISGKSVDERNDAIAKVYINSGRISEFLTADALTTLGLMRIDDPQQPDDQPATQTDLCDYAWRCYKTFKEPRIAETTKSRETSAINAICRFFKGRTVESITVSDVQEWLYSRAEDGLCKTTVGDQRKSLAWILNNAIEDKLITTNPATSSRLQICGYESKGTQVLSESEYLRLVSMIPTLEDPIEQLFLAILLLTGMRRSEVLALQWGRDIDFDDRNIHVQYARVCPNGVFRDKPPKSKAGDRHIPIQDLLYEVLLQHRKDSGYVITDKRGEAFSSDSSYKAFYAGLLKKIGLEGVSALTFRTTVISEMASTTIPPRHLKAIAGHSKISVTMDVYAKVDKKRLARSRNVLNEVLNPETT